MKRLRVDKTDEKEKANMTYRTVKSPDDSCFGEPEPGPSSQLRATNVEKVAITTINEEVQCEPTDSTDPDPVVVQAKAREALGNHLILKEIFKSLDLSNLLQFSLVNNFWNSCARTVLRENKKCVACIHRERMCLELKELDTLIGKSLNVPFNGLSILRGDSSTCHFDHDSMFSLSNTNPHTFYTNLVDKLNCKYIDIMVWTKNKIDLQKSTECLGQNIVKHILKTSASQLEGLSITDFINYIYDEDKHDTPLYTFLGFTEANNFRFPKLTHLQIFEKSAGMDWTALASTLLEATPNVREITGGISVVQLKLFIEQKKVNVLKELHFHPLYENVEYGVVDISEPGLQLFLDCIQLEPKLAKLSISTMSYENELIKNSDKWFPIVSRIYWGLLSSSSNTLQQLHIYHLDFILLSRLQIPPLTRVTHITVNYYIPKLAWTLSLRHYATVFPNVQSVTLNCDVVYQRQLSLRHFFQYMEEQEGFYISNSKEVYERQTIKTKNYSSCYSWSSVTKLKFECCSRRAFVNKRGFDPILSKIFPNLTDVTVSNYDGIGPVCDILWTAWPKVESITLLNMKDKYIHECLDEHFTGMSQESCNIIQDLILKKQNFSELIEKYQTKPSIRNLIELKRFRVEFNHGDCDYNRFKSNSYNEIFLSEVTKKCALDFMPSLSFEIKGNTCVGSSKLCYFALDHLKPNVKLFITPDPDF